MNISKETLRGYLLEEALAYLIRHTGYTLLVDKNQDPLELKNRGHGLVVKGRGSEHQVDVLGELNWIPAFTYPIRLFIEAKYRRKRTDISSVRNAVGILEDINQNYFPLQNRNMLIKRYTYNYALFSTSGFSQEAVNMAVAHRISLIDLSTSDFEELRDSIDESAEAIIGQANNYIGNQNLTKSSLVSSLRKYIRLCLGIWPLDNHRDVVINDLFEEALLSFFRVLKNYEELFVGMAEGPFLLTLKAENPEIFLAFARANPTHYVSINWSDTDNNGRRWHIRPEGAYNTSYELSFALPKLLGDLIFKSEDPLRTALDIKRELFSNIIIYRLNHNRDELFRLQWRIC